MRLDERAKRSVVLEGWRHRLLYDEACACQLTEGDLVHLDQVVLFDARAHPGEASFPIFHAQHILECWRWGMLTESPAALLRAERPGRDDNHTAEAPTIRSESVEPEVDLISVERRATWRRVFRESREYTPLLSAAIAWDAWMMLLPERAAAWRGPLLAALVLRDRGVTGEFLLPIDTGRRHAPYRRDPKHDFPTRIAGFLSWVAAGAACAGEMLTRVESARGSFRDMLKKRRSTSSLSELVDLLIARPCISVPMAARKLEMTQQGVMILLHQLGSTVQCLTERKRHRVWGIAPLIHSMKQ